MAWRFTPRWYSVLLTALALPLFISLGFWQWNRGQARQAQWDEFARGDAPAIDASAASLAQLPRYARVRIAGEPDGGRQFLLENISHRGAPGYYVLTVLRLAEGSRLLVNRGWVPFSGFREQLPDVRLPEDAPASWTITGRIGALPVAGLASGRVGPPLTGNWPRVASFPTLAQLEAAYGAPLLPVVLMLDDGATPGYLRDWAPSGLPPERHVGYAVQWWALAVLLAGLFIGVNLKKRDD
ncbi:MAG TPA: SURF1 family protein [Steroidobacteraceae bacterium]|nr:SURF1 family protein [Steroidobacteraceae bacterium]